ncbi:hypothetical protein JCM10207_004805 [Rhodosporidiobolus poonsookiae]
MGIMDKLAIVVHAANFRWVISSATDGDGFVRLVEVDIVHTTGLHPHYKIFVWRNLTSGVYSLSNERPRATAGQEQYDTVHIIGWLSDAVVNEIQTAGAGLLNAQGQGGQVHPGPRTAQPTVPELLRNLAALIVTQPGMGTKALKAVNKLVTKVEAAY